MTSFKHTLLILLVTLLIISIDQSSKSWASTYLNNYPVESYFRDLLRLGYHENVGAFLGLGNNLSEQIRFILFVVLVGGILFFLLMYLVFNLKKNASSILALSLIFSGGLSNFYDRIANSGAVVDFLNVGIGSLRSGIFNVADIAIMLGVLLFVCTREKIKIINE
jgi:signal peptidase II